MPQFVLVLRDSGAFPPDISAEEIQNVINRYIEWNIRVKALSGQKLRDSDGRVLKKNGSKVTITNGPYAESKEIVGGFQIIEAPNYDAALKLCDGHPHLDFGSIELREIEPT